jgi:hypothetical protein
MYCAQCGAEAVEGFRFCKRCGGNLGTNDLGATQQVTYVVKSHGVAWALAFATTLIALIGLAIVVLGTFSFIDPDSTGHQPSDGMVGMGIVALIFGSLCIFGIVGMLIRVFSRFIGQPNIQRVEQPDNQVVLNPPPAALRTPQNLQPLASARGSVTEGTTRTFDHPAYREPAARE